MPPKERPTAVFAANDLMAIGVLAAARLRGIAVPAELSVVGMDDIPLSDSVYPSLTTVHLPLRELGAVVMRAVLDVLRGEVPPETWLLPPAPGRAREVTKGIQ